MEEIIRLTNKKGRFSQSEIDFIIAEGAKYGIMPPKKTSCVNCWRDMAIEVAIAMRPKTKGRRLWGDAAKNGVIFKGKLITNAIIDDELLEWMDKEGFPQYLLRNED